MLPVRKVASESQLLRGTLHWAVMGVQADSPYRATTISAAAPDRARIRRFRAGTGRRGQTPDHLDIANARPRPGNGNHALP